MGEEVELFNLGGVEGIPQRTVAMRFSRHFASYHPGETAYFLAPEAAELTSRGVAAPPVPTAAVLDGNPPPNPATTLQALQLISNGSFAVTISGTLREFGLFDFTGAASLTDVAGIISAATGAAGAPFNWVTNRFVMQTTATGPTATLTYASAASSGTNLSTTLRLTAATGAILTQGT